MLFVCLVNYKYRLKFFAYFRNVIVEHQSHIKLMNKISGQLICAQDI